MRSSFTKSNYRAIRRLPRRAIRAYLDGAPAILLENQAAVIATYARLHGLARFEAERGLPTDIIRRTNAANHWETPGQGSNAQRWISKLLISCLRRNRWRLAPKLGSRMCYRC